MSEQYARNETSIDVSSYVSRISEQIKQRVDAGAAQEVIAFLDENGYLAAEKRRWQAESLREAAAWLDDPRTLPDIDESAAVAVIRELRYRADLIKSAMKETP